MQSQVCRCSEAAAPCDFLDRQFCCFEQPPLVETKAPDGPYFEAAIIHHTDCGSGLLADEKLRHGFAQRTRYDEETLADLPVLDPPETVRTDVERVLSDPRISPRITVSGHVYDVHTGLITTIVNPLSPTAAAAATS